MADKIGVTLGYGGGAKINGQSVFVTSGNLSRTTDIPSVQPYDMKTGSSTTWQRGKIVMGKGYHHFTGSISFDMTVQAVSSLITSQFLSRNSEFPIYISDGHANFEMNKCKWSSFSLSASPNSLVTGSINDFKEDLQTSSSTAPYIFTDDLLAYWQTGDVNTDKNFVESFTLTLSQTLTATHLNTPKLSMPAYIRCGALDVSLQITCWEDWFSHNSINIGPTKITLTNQLIESMEFSTGGPTDTGSHSYTMKAFSLTSSAEKLFTIA